MWRQWLCGRGLTCAKVALYRLRPVLATWLSSAAEMPLWLRLAAASAFLDRGVSTLPSLMIVSGVTSEYGCVWAALPMVTCSKHQCRSANSFLQPSHCTPVSILKTLGVHFMALELSA